MDLLSPIPHKHLIQALASEVRHGSIVGGVVDREKQERPLVIGAAEDGVEEVHRAGRVRQRHEAHQVQRGHEEARRAADRLVV